VNDKTYVVIVALVPMSFVGLVINIVFLTFRVYLMRRRTIPAEEAGPSDSPFLAGGGTCSADRHANDYATICASEGLEVIKLVNRGTSADTHSDNNAPTSTTTRVGLTLSKLIRHHSRSTDTRIATTCNLKALEVKELLNAGKYGDIHRGMLGAIEVAVKVITLIG